MRISYLSLLLLAACGPAPSNDSGLRDDIGDRGPATTRESASEASTERPEIPRDAPLVVFLGDSITAGLHLSANEAFPYVLQSECARRGHPFRLVNAGVSGDTSTGGLARIDWVLQQEPAVVVVELGGNDGLRGQDLQAIEANLRGIVTKSKAAGAAVLLLGMRLPPSYGADYTASFAAIYERIAAETGVAFVPYFMERVGGVPQMMLEDGLHPTARGHVLLADNILDAMISVLPVPVR